MSSKRALRRKECGSKVKHPSEDAAYSAVRMYRKQHGGHMTVYRCKWCNSWHIGHTPGRVRQSIRDKRRNKLR